MQRSLLSVGDVEEAFDNGQIAKFRWRVPNYSTNMNISLYSPNVEYLGSTWWLAIHQSGQRVWLSRNENTSGYRRPVRCSFGYRKADGSVEDIAHPIVMSHNVTQFVFSIDRRRHVTPSDELILICTMWKDESTHEEVVSRIAQRQGAGGGAHGRLTKGVSCSTQTDDTPCTNCRIHEDLSEDNSILLEHLRDLLHSGDDQDFLLKVKDKQFRAHKCVLRARSPVFAAMFRNQMTECAEDSITIDDCDPDSFGEFLRYVYTGEVDISSASHALGLFYAAEKYDFPRLKELSVQFLKNSLTTTGISDVIHLAVMHNEGELLQRALAFLAAHLEEVLLTVEWQRFLTAHPIQANEMCIKALQCVKKA